MDIKYFDIQNHYDSSHSTCEHCNKSFCSKSDLDNHLDYKNGDCSEKMYPCIFSCLNGLCSFTGKRSILEDHMNNSAKDHLSSIYFSFDNRIKNIEKTLYFSNEQLNESIHKSNKNVDSFEKIEEVTNLKSNSMDLSITNLSNNDKRSFEKTDNQIKLKFNANYKKEEQKDSIDSAYITYQSKPSSASVFDANILKSEQKTLNELFEKLIEYMHVVEKLQSNFKKTQEALYHKFEEIADFKKALMIAQVSIVQLEDKMLSLERGSSNGSLIWKITGMKRKIEEAQKNKSKSIYSPCFYSHSNGYKLSVRLFLNGNDSFFGRSLSIFIVIMKGEFDQLLKWPFKQKVTFMLIDQINNDFREHIIESFKPDINSESFKRPISNMNTASGIPMFCSLSKVHSAEHGYIKDDCMFIKTTIETHDLNETA